MSTPRNLLKVARPRQSLLKVPRQVCRQSRGFVQQAAPIKFFSGRGANIIEGSSKVEEENWDWYSPSDFYPVSIGELFPPRYQVVGKLGFGTRSTVWLCRDLSANKFVTLKVCERNSPAAARELAAFRQLSNGSPSHPGSELVRRLLDNFKIPRFNGDHICFVHEPLGPTIEAFRARTPDQKMPKDILRNVLKSLLLALDFLHTEAKMVHTDLQASNVHLRLQDDSVLEAFEERELKDPSPRKAVGNDYIFESRSLDAKWDQSSGNPVLCDFGEARYGQQFYTDPIQPSAYRSPEVMFQIPWTSSVDIWNVGVMTWHMFENRLLFPPADEGGNYSEDVQLTEMTARLGPPPLSFLAKSKLFRKYHIGISDAAKKLPQRSLEESETNLEGEEKKAFCAFIAKMVKWEPDQRATAKQLLGDPWLNGSS